MVRNFLLMFIAWGTLLVYENVGALNPHFGFNYNFPIFGADLRHASAAPPQKFSSPYHEQLGPYYFPSIGPYFPSEPTDKGRHSALLIDPINTKKQRIVGGFPVSDGLVPFMAAYLIPQVNGDPGRCGGTLITPKHVLTAAHCLGDKNSRPIGGAVIINSVLTDDFFQTAQRKVKAFKIHELFKFIEVPNIIGNFINEYDIAILTLDEEVTTVKPVKLANVDQTPAIVEGYKNAFTTGWGRKDPLSAFSPEALFGTVLKILSNADYQKIKQPDAPDIKSTQMSAYYPLGGRGTCRRDSGGPLLVGNEKDGFLQVGITSYGDALFCGLVKNNPGVFTRVSRFFDWININTGGLLE